MPKKQRNETKKIREDPLEKMVEVVLMIKDPSY